MHVALRRRKKSPASSLIGAQNGRLAACVLRAGRDEGGARSTVLRRTPGKTPFFILMYDAS
jgi:hypothetical protein